MPSTPTSPAASSSGRSCPSRRSPRRRPGTAWSTPAPPDDPVVGLARGIADDRQPAGSPPGRALPGEGRAIRPGDVMILVQRRNDLFDAIIRALKRAASRSPVPTCCRIGGELAVNDLLAALRFAATPSDDLSLAALLRSPLGGLSERELFELAHPRPKGTSLWRALRAEPAGRWPAVRALLADLLDRRRLPPPLRAPDPDPRSVMTAGGLLGARLGPRPRTASTRCSTRRSPTRASRRRASPVFSTGSTATRSR